jgi:hypothetical protein
MVERGRGNSWGGAGWLDLKGFWIDFGGLLREDRLPVSLSFAGVSGGFPRLNPLLRVLLGCVLAVPAFWAEAALRSIPEAAATTVLTMRGDGTVLLGSKVFALSPTAQIRDTANRIVLPSYLSGPYKVRVLVNSSGELLRAWILTAEEAAQPAPKF